MRYFTDYLEVKVKNFTLLIVLIFFGGRFMGQVFSWENPNNTYDSIRKDSLISAKISKDFFRRDTMNFIKSPIYRVVDDAVIVKNDRKKILGELNSKGSIIRGITFGNAQGSSVQSTMDMQISGKLSQDVSITASIYDNNLPIQADGYTQTLDEFDRILVELNIKDKSILRAGHIDLLDDKTYFGKYQRRSLGLQYQTQFGDVNKTFTDISIGVARSEFHRVRFQGVEGNQGPYRLNGKNGETFITIIAGSEQVYIDGILMKRGEDQDYTINYNTGEITFTTKRPIYKQNFITISYNYTNRNYSRFLVTGSVLHQREKFKAGLSWFWESDNKNAPLSLNLSEEDKKVLVNAGNNTEFMYSPSAKIVEYDVNKILYKKVSSSQGDYYEFSTDKNEVLYEVSFTYFGHNKGNYKLIQTTNNGRVFQYVGNRNGEYDAVRKLPSPQRSQVFSFHTEYKDEDIKIGTDISLSNYDINLFSSKDNKENIGYAGRIFGQKTFRKGDWEGTSALEYHRIDSRFRILDRINEVEFSRDFNLSQEFNQKTQNRLIFSFNNIWKETAFLDYRINYLNEKETYKGIKNELNFGWKKNKWATQASISYLKTEGIDQNTQFLRGNTLAEYTTKKGSWSIGADMEHNLRKINALQKYDATSFSWKQIFLQKKIGDSANTKLLMKIYLRDNDSIRNNQLKNINHIIGAIADYKIINTEKTQLSTLIHYRKFFYQNKEFSPNTNQDFVVGNISYVQQLFDNGIRIQTQYELGNGQEAQRTFQYIKVNDGQGVYKWTDYNGDGVQQLDEFEVAEYADLAQYIRVYTDAIRYLPSNKNKFLFSIFLNPYLIFNTSHSFVKRWNFNFSYSVDNSFLKKNRALSINPFEKGDILRHQNLLLSALFNSNEKSGWNATYRYTESQQLVNANFSIESSRRSSHFMSLGYRFTKDFRVDWDNTMEASQYYSQMFATRNYLLNMLQTRPKFTYQFTESTQAELSSAYTNKTRKDATESLKTIDITGALQWQNDKTSIKGSFSFINNDFKGNSFSIVGNQMLEGLKVGKNTVWSLFFQQRINSFISLNMNYEGRNSGERTIHIGSMQVKATF